MNAVVQLSGAGKRCDGLANPAAIQSLVTELVFNSFERVVVPRASAFDRAGLRQGPPECVDEGQCVQSGRCDGGKVMSVRSLPIRQLMGIGAICLVAVGVAHGEPAAPDPHELIEAAIDHQRSATSYSELRMLIHRPDWQRTLSIVAWTRGLSDALIRFTAPAKDAGNAILQLDEKMWTYTPKLNRVIRLPFSMMSQDWVGSDLSYNDLSRNDNVLQHYRLAVVDIGEADGLAAYTIEAVPFDSAPVVWGKEDWVVRDDYITLSQTFYDQDLKPLKRMETLEIGEMGGRMVGTRMRMSKLDEDDHYTEMEFIDMDFDLPLEDRLFTTFTLQSGSVPAGGRDG